ncbi:hypothetical protein CLF_103716 [Clonorchis sinensis]|uniref:Uncharacterized protein n=1 Tax=Clonorchis sinensis TaxID=79923 RepID=G7YNK5_CLOSI|nr:hypothetical protein CLF_103716 [Clonorchis sinensis]
MALPRISSIQEYWVKREVQPQRALLEAQSKTELPKIELEAEDDTPDEAREPVASTDRLAQYVKSWQLDERHLRYAGATIQPSPAPKSAVFITPHKWAEVADKISMSGRELKLTDLTEFVNTRSRVARSQFGQMARGGTQSIQEHLQRLYNSEFANTSASNTSLSLEEQKALLIAETGVERGGFRMRNWSSNDRGVLSAIDPTELTSGVRNLTTDPLPMERALGVQWDTESDTLVIVAQVNRLERKDVMCPLIPRFSCWMKLQKVVAWLLRYRQYLLIKTDKARKEALPSGVITVSELRQARNCLIKIVQSSHFAQELQRVKASVLEARRPSNRTQNGSLRKLSSVLIDNILCVGERLIKVPVVDYLLTTKTPNNRQYEFMARRSANTCQVDFFNHISSAYDTRLCIILIYLHIRQASDKFPTACRTAVENVQRSFTKSLFPVSSTLPYSIRCLSLELDPLWLRRIRKYRPPHEVFIFRSSCQICQVACHQAVIIAACALKKELQLPDILSGRGKAGPVYSLVTSNKQTANCCWERQVAEANEVLAIIGSMGTGRKWPERLNMVKRQRDTRKDSQPFEGLLMRINNGKSREFRYSLAARCIIIRGF